MQQIISEENSMTQLYKGIGSVLKKERNILQETLSEINSNGEVQNGLSPFFDNHSDNTLLE